MNGEPESVPPAPTGPLPRNRLPLLGLFLAVLLGGGILGTLVVRHMRAPAPRPAPRATSAPRPPTPPPPANAPSVPPTPRQLSWAGLSVGPYKGKFRGDYPVQKVTSALEQDLMDAIKDLKDGVGLFPTAEDRISFEPRDASDCPFEGPYNLVVSKDGAIRVDITLEPLLLRWYPARRLLSAALAEAILTREAPGFAPAPPWLRHGLALTLGRFGEYIERRGLLGAVESPLREVRPLGDPGGGWMVGFWAFSSLQGRRGDGAVRGVADALRFQPDWREALKASGESAGDLEAAYRSWAAAHVRDLAANREEFLDMVGLLRREDERQALVRLDAFVRERPLDLYTGDARYFQAYALYRTGEYDRAVRAFTDLLANDPHSTSMQGKAHFFLGRCYQVLSYPPLAEEQYALARTDPDSALLVQMATKQLKEVQ